MTAPTPVAARASRWALRVGLLSDVGQTRERNEDAMAAFLPYRDEVPPARGDALFVVADGMGGHEAGDIASAFVAEAVRDWFTELPAPDEESGRGDGNADFPDQLRALLKETNRALVEMGQRAGLASGAGSTVTMACFRDGKLYVAHVGDTRLYRLRGGTFEQLTLDHSWVAEQRRAGLLGEEEAATHPQRHMLTECLGVGPGVSVFTVTEEVMAGDRFLLCSDGLHGPLEDETLARVLAGEREPQQAARRLVALANDHSGPDNITAVVVYVDAPESGHADGEVPGRTEPALAITVPGAHPIAPGPAAESGVPRSVDRDASGDRANATRATRRATLIHRLLLGLGILVLAAAAVFGGRSLRAADSENRADPVDRPPEATSADSIVAVLPPPRFVPAAGGEGSPQGRMNGETEP